MAKKIVFLMFFAIVPAFLYANYTQNMAAGLAAYKANRMTEAYNYYLGAYKEQPSPKLKQVLMYIYNKIKPNKPAAKAGDKDTPLKWVLMGVDAAALGFTIYAGLDYYNQADIYDDKYALIDNTTPANYNILLAEDKKFRDKEGMYVAGIVLATLSIGYTLADLFFLHAAFPVTTAAAFDPLNGRVMLALNYKY